MPRRARALSTTGIYHVISRGVAMQIIFEDEADRFYYLDRLTKVLDEEEATLLAWCLMSNHTHLLVQFRGEPGRVMKRINIKYAEHFNHKYKRQGHLFQDRYKSEPVETESYLLSVARYIHHNPERAGIVADYKEYFWSSYAEYIDTPIYCDPEFLLTSFGGRKAFSEFHEIRVAKQRKNTSEEEAANANRMYLTDEEAVKLVVKEFGERGLKSLLNAPKEKRNAGIRRMRELGLGCRQIQRLTGVSYGVVQRC